jgi:hypothetical protein
MSVEVVIIFKEEDAEKVSKLVHTIPSDFHITLCHTVIGDGEDVIKQEGKFTFKKVYHHELDFAYFRNRAKNHSTCDWIFSLDADEEVHNWETLWNLCQEGDAEAYHVAITGFNRNKESITPYIGYGLRLFRNKYDWVYKCHEQIELEDNKSYSNVIIVHHGYTTPEINRNKLLRNLRIMQKDPARFESKYLQNKIYNTIQELINYEKQEIIKNGISKQVNGWT